MASAAPPAAFDAAAADYDLSFGRNPIGLVFRHVVQRRLEALFRPGARLVLGLLGPTPLPALVRRALTGLGEPRRRRAPRVAGVPVAVVYPTLHQARRALGPALVWTDAFALGVALPGPEHERWAA